MKQNKLTILIGIFFMSMMANSKAQQVDCNNLYLDTGTFYIAYQPDTIVYGNLFYFDSGTIKTSEIDLSAYSNSIYFTK